MKRLADRLITVAVASLAAILLFEIVLRVIGFSEPMLYHADLKVGWGLRPGSSAWFTKEGRSFVEINSAGWRDQEHALAKPADVYRIAVLGDSYVEALQVAQQEAFWARLPQELASCGFAAGKRIEVLAFGVSGYGTAQEYLVLESRAMRYQPDLVLLAFTNGNDVRNNSAKLEDKKYPFYVLNEDGTLRLDDSFAAAPGLRIKASVLGESFLKMTDSSRVGQLLIAARPSAMIRNANAVAAQGAPGAEQGLEPVVLAAPSDARWDEAWRITEKLLAKIDAYSRRNGARFLVVTVPYAIQVHPDPLIRTALQAKLGVADLFYPDRRIAEFAVSHGIGALPLAPEMQALAEKSQVYFHGFANSGMGRGHWNADGHRVAAELIARRLCSADQ